MNDVATTSEPLRTLHAALGRDHEELCRRIVDGYVDEIEAYRLEADDEGRDRMVANVRVQIESMRGTLLDPAGRPSEPPPLAIDVAKARAEDGFPLEAVLQAYHVATRSVWAWMNGSDLLQEDNEAIIRVGWPYWLNYVDRAMRVAANAYVKVAEERARMDGASRRHFLAMLLNGQLQGVELQRWLAMIGHSAVQHHLVVALTWQRGDEMAISELSDRIASHVLSRLAAFPRPETHPIAAALDHHSAVLVPVRNQTPDEVRQIFADALRDLVPDDVSVVGVVSEPVADLSQVNLLFPLLRQVADAIGTDRSMVCLDEVTWFDHAVAALRDTFEWYRPRGSVSLTEQLADPAHGDWVPTLEAWFASGFNVKRAAETMHVHPNTVYYRLGRIESETGIDPREGPGLVDLLLLSRLARFAAVSHDDKSVD